jgi:UPF0176 protein
MVSGLGAGCCAHYLAPTEAPVAWPGARPGLPRIRPVTELSVVAAYRFVDIDDAADLRDALFRSAQAATLKGTVLVAPEGINLSLAAPTTVLQRWVQALQQDPRFSALDAKWHRCTALPFARLKVKLKREIIRMNESGVVPHKQRAPSVSAATLRRWLTDGHCDEGRAVVLLDTRNDFEVNAGRFAGALDWRLPRFSAFPEALQQHQSALHGKTVVSYCTGGIRCEKAALWMAQQGVQHVHQLDGGILRYFELEPGAPHWQGQCVVFDERSALGPDLQPSAPVTAQPQ